MTPLRVYVGYDGREARGYAVTVGSLLRHASIPLDVRPLVQADLRGKGIYSRPETVDDDGQRWCLISQAPCSTEFSNSRFAVPVLGRSAAPQAGTADGWTLWCDGDFLFRADVKGLLDRADPAYAVMVVKHRHEPGEDVKMDGVRQTAYARKNWSSLVLWNLAHPATELVAPCLNHWPGAALHAFRWLHDEEIGELPARWNWLAGVDDMKATLIGGPDAVHFTVGTPDMPGHERTPYAGEWWALAESLGLGPDDTDERRS